MFENLAVLLGRHVRLRGTGRLLSALYPCRRDSPRYVQGVRSRADGLKIKVDTREHIDWQMVFLGSYEPHLAGIFAGLGGAGSVVADIGANVGAHTLTMARQVGTEGRVLAFEPNPTVRRKLETNISLNGLNCVEIFECALGDRQTQMKLRVPRSDTPEASNSGLSSLLALDTPHDLVDVLVQPFDSVIESLSLDRLDLIKIDVQGFEQRVLQGMGGVLQRFSPAIVFEYEDWAWSLSGSHWSVVESLLFGGGYRLWRIATAGNRARLAELREGSQPGGHLEVLALKRNDPRLAMAEQAV